MLLETSSSTDKGVEFYKNDKGEMFVGDADEDNPYGFYFTFTKEDWVEMKKFIDDQFKH
jgi:hypothetical protein